MITGSPAARSSSASAKALGAVEVVVEMPTRSAEATSARSMGAA